MKKLGSSFLALVLVFVLVACTRTEDDPTKTLASIDVTTNPTKVEYIEEESFDPTGLVVTATYDWSDDTETTLDVTDEVTFDKTVLELGDEQIVVSYTEGDTTVTTTILITVLPIKGLIGEGPVLDLPASDLTVTTASTSGEAVAHFYTEYQASVFHIQAIVVDDAVEEGTSVFNSDGIEVLVFNDSRGFGIIDGTILINVSAGGAISIKQAAGGSFVNLTSTDIAITAEKVSFAGKYVEGYRINIDIPYDELDLADGEQGVTFLPGLYNRQGSVAQVNHYSGFDSDVDATHTFVLVEDDNTYQEHPWFQLGYTFGTIGSLSTVDAWDISNDDGTPTATANLPVMDPGTDNNAYMYRHTDTELYAYVKLSATSVLNNEQWGKFGLMVSSLDGQDGFFFFVDAYGDGTNMTGTNIGVVPYLEGEWVWSNATTIASIASADDYQNDSYIELAIYRYGSMFELFVNGESVGIKSGFPGLGEDDEGVVSLASFNITLMAKEYGITIDETVLNTLRFETTEITHLFVGDSFLDPAFWTDYSMAFGDESVNLAVGGSKAEYWMNQVANLSSLYVPEHIILHAGVNDITADVSGADTLAYLTAFVEEVNLLMPDAMIHFVSIAPNLLLPSKQAEYDIVNNGMIALAASNDSLSYIDTASIFATDTERFLAMDGLHLNADGIAVLTQTIQSALNLTRVETAQGLGDYMDYARSGGWSFEADHVRNTGSGEQQIYFDGIHGTEFAASVELSVNAILNGDPFPKVGFALKSSEQTLFFFIDVNATLDNNWANYVLRPNGSDWQWGAIGNRQYVDLGPSPYAGGSYKTLEVVRMGTAIYFLADGRIVQYVEGVFAEDEATQLSVMTFNLDLQLRNATHLVDTAFADQLSAYQIAAKQGPMIDGDLSDWDSAVLANPFHIYGSDGRTIAIYTYMEEDGLYIAYDALFLNNLVSDAGNWWENTNIEFRLGATGEQRFASANGSFSRFQPGVRDVGMAVWTVDTSNTLNNAIVELFIPWGMIEGYDKHSAYVPAGFAFLNPGEEGSLWADGHFWYIPEADPGMRNVLITDTGLYEAQDIVIDGDYSEWDPTVLNSAWISTADGRTFASTAFVGSDGFYGAFSITTPDPLNLNTTFRAGDWWQNPNLEIWANDQHARVMFYNGMITSTGRINDIAYTYDDTTNTLVVEFFISFHSLGLTEAPASIQYRIGSNSLNGGWFMPVDPNQAVTSSGLPPRP